MSDQISPDKKSLSRRDFLKLTGLGLGTLAFNPPNLLPLNPVTYPPSREIEELSNKYNWFEKPQQFIYRDERYLDKFFSNLEMRLSAGYDEVWEKIIKQEFPMPETFIPKELFRTHVNIISTMTRKALGSYVDILEANVEGNRDLSEKPYLNLVINELGSVLSVLDLTMDQISKLDNDSIAELRSVVQTYFDNGWVNHDGFEGDILLTQLGLGQTGWWKDKMWSVVGKKQQYDGQQVNTSPTIQLLAGRTMMSLSSWFYLDFSGKTGIQEVPKELLDENLRRAKKVEITGGNAEVISRLLKVLNVERIVNTVETRTLERDWMAGYLEEYHKLKESLVLADGSINMSTLMHEIGHAIFARSRYLGRGGIEARRIKGELVNWVDKLELWKVENLFERNKKVYENGIDVDYISRWYLFDTFMQGGKIVGDSQLLGSIGLRDVFKDVIESLDHRESSNSIMIDYLLERRDIFDGTNFYWDKFLDGFREANAIGDNSSYPARRLMLGIVEKLRNVKDFDFQRLTNTVVFYEFLPPETSLKDRLKFVLETAVIPSAGLQTIKEEGWLNIIPHDYYKKDQAKSTIDVSLKRWMYNTRFYFMTNEALAEMFELCMLTMSNDEFKEWQKFSKPLKSISKNKSYKDISPFKKSREKITRNFFRLIKLLNDEGLALEIQKDKV